MWAPADIFTPTVNAVSLVLKRATTLAWDHLGYLLIAVAVIIALIVVFKQVRGRPRR